MSVALHPKGLLLTILLVCLPLLSLCARPAYASPEFSCQTGESCSYCHEDPDGGGTLTLHGESFRDAGYVLEHPRRILFRNSALRLVTGFIHVLAAVVWFGAIFYIHLFVGPRSLTGGLPRRERILGWACIMVTAATGIILTLLRIHSLETLWTTTFGIVWLVKVTAFVLMVVIAAVVTTWLNRRMRQAREEAGEYGPDAADGKEGERAQFVFEGELYDASESKLWRQGVHMGRHRSGADLTGAMADAPHGPEVLERIQRLGAAAPVEREKPLAARAFVFLAYVILGFMLIILFCVAYWNWGAPLVLQPLG